MSNIAHGGRLSEARRLFPNASEPWLDLSTGINPQPYPFPELPTECFARLPEPKDLEVLHTVAAKAYGVADPTMVVAAPGTQILIELLPKLWQVPSVSVLVPTYMEHAYAWTKNGAKVLLCESFDELSNAAVAVLCNPNNPDGRRFAAERLLLLADALAADGGLLVVDETFADLEGSGLSIASALPHPAVVILRSFGKAYGLAGLRLGFALAAPDRAEVIRDALGPWAVSGPAIAIGLEALRDRAWLVATAERLARETQELDTCLSRCGLSVLGGTRLFRLADAPNALAIFARLGNAGIFIRRFAERPTWLRFGQPGSVHNMARLKAALSPQSQCC
jgi:cobalamin biosynthetic protein CobC